MKRFWLRNEKLFICLTYILSVMVFSVWAAQVAVVSTDTREQAWAKETLNNSDLQTNIDGKETADAAIVKSDEAETLSAAWDLGTPSAGVGTNLTGIPLTTGVTGILPLVNGGTGANLADPGADRVGFWDDSATSFAWLTMGTNLSITDTTLNATGSGGTTVDAIGDAAGAGAVDFVTYLQQWDVGTAGFQIGDGGSNYVQFSTTGITFGGTYTMSANLVSDYTTYTPAATEPATTDGLLRNVTGLTGLGDTFGFWDGTAAQYFVNYVPTSLTGGDLLIYNATSTKWANVSVTGAITIDEDGVSSLTQSAMVVNTITTFAAPTTANPYTLTAANCYNASVFYGATGEIDLPAGVDGMAVLIKNTGAFTITIDPNGSEVIVRDGVTQTGGVSITLSSGAGNQVALLFDGTYWVTFGKIGTLAEGT